MATNPASAPGRGVALLGPVLLDGRDAGGASTRALLAALCVGGRPCLTRSVAALADDVWGEDPPQNPRAALQTLVSRVRAGAGADVIVSAASGYALGAREVDLDRARHLADEAQRRAADDPVRLDLVDEALALWRGEPGADLGDAPIAAQLTREAGVLRDRLLTDRAHVLTALGRGAEAVDALAAQAEARPFDEPLHRELMSALADTGRTQDALAVFARLRTGLREEWGVSPSSETIELHARLLRDGPAEGPVQVRIGIRAAPNPLIGRDDDLAAIRNRLGSTRLLTVVGAGGLGKTRVVQTVAAASVLPVVAVVELASTRNDEDVLPAIAATLGVSVRPDGTLLDDERATFDLRARVLQQLGERPTLLVLDNCEQIIDGVARWAADALAAVPDLHLLTTSRTPLAIAGEVVYPLSPLSSDGAHGPAVELFLARARAVRPDAVIADDVAVRLCTRLDGLPLAIELAAARIRTMTAEQIEARLSDRFALLTSGDRSAPARHRTLEAVIDWSWDLLDVQARSGLETLSILPGGFSGGTAARVFSGEGIDVDDLLDRLVAHSLLVVSEEESTGVRFRMLETVREFALTRLIDSGRVDAAWDAVTRWAREFALARVDDVFELPVFYELRAEHDNLLAILRRAREREDDSDVIVLFAALSQVWLVRRTLSELAAFAPAVTLAVRRVTDADVPAEALLPVLVITAFGLMFTEDPGTLRILGRVRALRRRRPDLASLPAMLADVITEGGGIDAQSTALTRMREDPDPRRRMIGELIVSQIAENSGDAEVGKRAAARAWELAIETETVWASAIAASAYAQLAAQTGEAASALEWLERSGDGFARFGADDQLRQQRWMRAGGLLRLGRLDEARETFADLAAAPDHVQDPDEVPAMGSLGLAEVARVQGDREGACRLYQEAMGRFGAGERSIPWQLMATAAFLSAAVLDETLPAVELEKLATSLRTRARSTERGRGNTDRPLLGTALTGWSAWALTQPDLRDRGLAALALAEVLGARQDLPSLALDEHRRHAAGIVGAEALDAARASAETATADERVARARQALRI